MALFTAFAIYFVIWWLCLFVVLAFKGPRQMDVGEISHGTEPSAPAEHKIGKKLLINSLVAAVIYCVFWWIVVQFEISFADIPKFGPDF